jgi:Xaa-Pro aminopeptidase
MAAEEQRLGAHSFSSLAWAPAAVKQNQVRASSEKHEESSADSGGAASPFAAALAAVKWYNQSKHYVPARQDTVREGVLMPELCVESPFSRKELRARRDALLAFIREETADPFLKKADAAVFARAEEVFYLTGYWTYGSSSCFLICDLSEEAAKNKPLKKQWTILMRSMESNNTPAHVALAKPEDTEMDVHVVRYEDVWFEKDDPDKTTPIVTVGGTAVMSVLLDVLGVKPSGDAGYVECSRKLLKNRCIAITYANWLAQDLVDLGAVRPPRLGQDLETRFRVTKSETEMALVQRAADLCSDATTSGINACLKAGANENTVGARIIKTLLLGNADIAADVGVRWASFMPFVKIGPGGGRGEDGGSDVFIHPAARFRIILVTMIFADFLSLISCFSRPRDIRIAAGLSARR